VRKFLNSKISFALLSILILVTANIACDSKDSENKIDILLSIDFDKDDNSAFVDSTTNQLVYCPGIEGEGLNLEKCPSIPALHGTDTTWFSSSKDFSISLWVKSNTALPDTTIILSNSDFRTKDAGIYGKQCTGKGFTLYNVNGGWGWNIGNGGLHYLYEPIAENQPIADNQWHLLAFTHNSAKKEVRLYYNGINMTVLKIGDLDGRDIMSNLPLQLGSCGDNSPKYKSFQGQIDKVRVWGTVFSAENFRKEYQKYFGKKDEPELNTDFITVVNWNIWHGGTHFTLEKDGFDGIERITDLIRNAGADIVLMQETYGAGSRISSKLGFYYYEASSRIGAVWGANLSVMSRFPMRDAYMIEERSNYGKNYAFNNGGVEIGLSKHKSLIAFSNWYNHRKPEDLKGALNKWSGLIENADNVPIIWGGDFNSISHLDDGIGESGHSKLMTNAGFIDSYRTYFPDAEKNPGYSGPGFRDRIDYIYYKGAKLELIEAAPIIDNFKGKNNTPGYPSDHLGFVAKFKVN
jgi:hypothetical protein